ncbi:MAG: RNA 3'-terminal phosphate cyclase [Phycisphaerae bacterium]|nr:RNA 3'-terminal phosphate cyclase [Phycisphaerae bacterium]
MPSDMIEIDGVTIEGGTHTSWAPPFDFVTGSLLPALAGLGATVTARLDRHGFYPAGGGSIHVRIEPTTSPRAVQIYEREPVVRRKAQVIIAKLPFAVATARGAGACSLTTTALSRHATTNSESVRTFLGRAPCIEPLDNRTVRWTIA